MSSTIKGDVDLSPDEKRALLAQLLQEKASSSPARKGLTRIQAMPRDGTELPLSFGQQRLVFPASFAQQRLWFLDQLEPGSPLYNISRAIRMSGALKVEALQQTLEGIVVRHESLRTTFSTVDSSPVQVIAERAAVALPVTDLSRLPESEREAEMQRLAEEEWHRPFDLAQGPLFRASLLRLDEDDHVLLLSMHHIVSDGWSVGVLFRELTALYEAFTMGKASPLAELPIQYADFAQWQREWLQGEVLDRQLAYWREQLAGAPPVLELPTDHPHPAVQSFRGAHQSLLLPKEVSEGLKALSQREGVTLFMTLLAAFQTLLARYTNQEDIVVGSPIANRNRAEIEGLIGFFVNTLVLRTDVSGDPSFRELLGRVREVALGAYAHPDMPFEKLVEELQPERDLSRTPLFQVLFALQNAPRSALELSGLRLRTLATDSGTSMFDLELFMWEETEGVRATVVYSTDLFEAATITRMLGHLKVLLEGIVADPDQRLSELPLLTLAERHQLLGEWNDTRVDYPRDLCVHKLFEAQVERTPDAVAVLFEGERLSYGELNQRANQVAHYLRRRGVGPEVLVGISMERSVEMLVGLLGILKAGGAYVPLDPAYPAQRLAFMLEDARVSMLVTQARLATRLPQQGVHVVCLDADWETIAGESDENMASEATAENLAYVIYTSGSTGRPKGVLIAHRALVNHSLAVMQHYGLQPHDRILQFASLSFDVAAEELFPSWLSGATVVLQPEQLPASVPEFIQFSEKAKLSVVNLPTPYWQEWVFEFSRSGVQLPSTLRLVIVGTEKALAERLATWQQAVGDRVRWINAYGPTEGTITTTTYEPVANRGNEKADTVPIGRPLANRQVYVLDSHLQPVPIGIPGELYIGGDSLARGYLDRPELTAERFIVNPFMAQPGARLYKTGDRARYLPDGNIEFLGRLDDQVKIRGFRIELGEVETVLGQHSGVHETVVMAREDESGDKRLVAYVVAAQEPAPTVSELRSFLREKLPDYMVPSAFVLLDELPLTPNGKVDRCALPAPDHIRPELEEAFVAPRTPVEEVVAGIWANILGVDQVGVHDNFFELGGDSILSIQIIARANQVGLRFTPKQLFQHQTIAELAVLADVSCATLADQGIVVGPVLLTPIQHWFFEQNLPDLHHYNQAFLLEMRERLDLSMLEKAMQLLVVHHDALRLHFVRKSLVWQQINAGPDGLVSFSRVDLSALPEAEQESALSAAATELQASLNISEGPLLQVAFFDLGPQKPGRLLIVIHHLVVDGVSWRILLEDLQTAYQQLSLGKTIQLPPKTTSFKDWAQRLTEHAQSKALKQELAYWLAKPRARISYLPVDYPEGDNTEASARSVERSLSVEETRVLLQEVPKVYHTQVNDALLTALVETFSHWTGVCSLLVDLEGHGREEIIENVDLSRTVGWFTAVFPVLLDLEEISNPGEALKSVKEQLRRIPNRGIGYGLLRYLSGEVEIAEKLRILPQAEVSFNYLGQFDQVLHEASPLKLARESSGLTSSPRGTRRYLLNINGMVTEGQLRLSWKYSKHIHRRATVESLARGFMEALRSLIIHCQFTEVGSYTPSDFPLAKLDEQQLNELFTKVEFEV